MLSADMSHIMCDLSQGSKQPQTGHPKDSHLILVMGPQSPIDLVADQAVFAHVLALHHPKNSFELKLVADGQSL